MTRVALCFPGQGSQVPGMADGLVDLPGAAGLLAAASEAGLDLAGALRGDDEALRATDVAQPALLFVEAVLADLLEDAEVVAVAGHSVGEYAACVAAGALDPAAAMHLVVERGRAMASMRRGGMLALLGAGPELAEEVCREAAAAVPEAVVVVANLNGPQQTVLSGDPAGLEAAQTAAGRLGVRRAVPLNVGGAFHSPLMEQASAGFARHLDAVEVRPPRRPVVCNVDAEAVSDAEGLRRRLRAQLTAPVRWTDCVRRLVDLGAEALVEVGPQAVLTGLARRIVPNVPAIAVGSPEAAGRLGEALAAGATGG